MCGILAVMGQPSARTLRIFELLLSVSILRGKDSTGVAAIVGNSPIIVKDTGWPLKLIRSRTYEKEIISNENKAHCYIGHNRSATIGKVTKINAHPFSYDDITLVHNGTLKSNLEATKGKDFDTDSESIAHSINEKGIDWTWKNLDGAASLIYHEKKKNILNIITNGERPLYFTTTKGNKFLIIASESWMIRNLCLMSGLKLKKDKVWYPENNMLFKFSYDKKNNVVREYNSRELKEYDRWENWGKRDAGYLGLGRKPTPIVQNTIIPINNNISWNKEEFIKNYGTKCSFCEGYISYTDAVIVDDNLAACGICTSDEQINAIRNDV